MTGPSEVLDSSSAQATPVFVDATGRRKRRLRRVGYLVGAGCAAYAIMLTVSLTGGPISPRTLLPVPGAPEQTVSYPPLRPVSAAPAPVASPARSRPGPPAPGAAPPAASATGTPASGTPSPTPTKSPRTGGQKTPTPDQSDSPAANTPEAGTGADGSPTPTPDPTPDTLPPPVPPPADGASG